MDSRTGFFSRERIDGKIVEEWIPFINVEDLVVGDVIDATSYTRGESDQYMHKVMTITGITNCFLDVRIAPDLYSRRIGKKRLGQIFYSRIF
jgi:hypothetical protein